MRRFLGLPTTNLLCSLALLLLALGASIFAAISQPWLGVVIDRQGAQPRLLVSPQGPAARAGLAAGEEIAALAGMAILPADLIEEPDVIESYALLDEFLARQEIFARNMARPEGVLLQASTELRVQPQARRPLWDLPWIFWGQLATGSIGYLFGAWVFALRSSGATGGFLYLAGAGLMVSAFAAALYSSRELALPAQMLRYLSAVNLAGAMMFGMGNLGIFLGYPKPLAGLFWRWMAGLILAVWWGLGQLRLFPAPAYGAQLPIATALGGIICLLLWQYLLSRRDPPARAALAWIGLSIVMGAGEFVTSISLPKLLGFEPALSQGVAFLFFLPIYLGLALGVARYRLFDVQDWAYRIFFYLGGIWLLLLLDAALITLVALDRAPAFGLSLLVVALAYLPLRDTLAAKIFGRRENLTAGLYREITDIALTPERDAQAALWQSLLARHFQPLEIGPSPEGVYRPRLAEEGVALCLPEIEGLPALRLAWAKGGRRLFTRRDLDLAATLAMILQSACQSRKAFETGVYSERSRIARDMHDNIGIQLNSALQSPNAARKDDLIRETLADLRAIINANAAPEGSTLAESLADLRAELGEYAEMAGKRLQWREGPLQGLLAPEGQSALRAILREALGNAIGHGAGETIEVTLATRGQRLELIVCNPCNPSEEGAVAKGGGQIGASRGLLNMQARLAALGGRFRAGREGGGLFRLQASLPLAKERGQQ